MMQPPTPGSPDIWPALPYQAWKDTCVTLHLWAQIVGKVRLTLTPWVNHSWHATLYVTARGLTTSPIPYDDGRAFQIDFDFIDHALFVRASDGAERRLPLRAQPVAEFHDALLAALSELEMPVRIHGSPNEVPDPIPFREDREHAAYDHEYAQRLWRVLVQVDRVFKQFRTSFLGKVSPVHLFWGSFDLAVTRFSGRSAPLHPGGLPHLPDAITREAYSHEVSSAGFWPGGGGLDAAFYSYAYPAPDGFTDARVAPEAAHYDDALGEFLLPYDAVRCSSDPDATLLAFLESTYRSAADLGRWDREALECPPGQPLRPRPVAEG
jgi:hypothetical protein